MRIPIASDGWRFIIGFGVVGAILVRVDQWWSIPWGILCLLLMLFCLWFFRDFDVETPPNDDLLYSPGNGLVVSVGNVVDGPHAGDSIIRIFLSVFDVHVQRIPVNGTVSRIEYKKGTFLDARHERAHLDNEQNLVTVITKHGPVIVNQIAGLIARRIVCWTREGAAVSQGQRYGLIRFGSQVDVIVPKDSVIWNVKPGDRVAGGETVLAKWK